VPRMRPRLRLAWRHPPRVSACATPHLYLFFLLCLLYALPRGPLLASAASTWRSSATRHQAAPASRRLSRAASGRGGAASSPGRATISLLSPLRTQKRLALPFARLLRARPPPLRLPAFVLLCPGWPDTPGTSVSSWCPSPGATACAAPPGVDRRAAQAPAPWPRQRGMSPGLPTGCAGRQYAPVAPPLRPGRSGGCCLPCCLGADAAPRSQAGSALHPGCTRIPPSRPVPPRPAGPDRRTAAPFASAHPGRCASDPCRACGRARPARPTFRCQRLAPTDVLKPENQRHPPTGVPDLPPQAQLPGQHQLAQGRHHRG
jgi:hypothetical protein